MCSPRPRATKAWVARWSRRWPSGCRWSGGKSIDGLARRARGEGIGALCVVEDYLLRVEYGLAPFRALTRVAHDEPSVMNAGIDLYRSEIARARLAHPEVVLVPGVEV